MDILLLSSDKDGSSGGGETPSSPGHVIDSVGFNVVPQFSNATKWGGPPSPFDYAWYYNGFASKYAIEFHRYNATNGTFAHTYKLASSVQGGGIDNDIELLVDVGQNPDLWRCRSEESSGMDVQFQFTTSDLEGMLPQAVFGQGAYWGFGNGIANWDLMAQAVAAEWVDASVRLGDCWIDVRKTGTDAWQRINSTTATNFTVAPPSKTWSRTNPGLSSQLLLLELDSWELQGNYNHDTITSSSDIQFAMSMVFQPDHS